MTALTWFELVLLYLVLHFGLYVLKLRNLPAFSQESTIFGYHFWSAAGLSMAAIIAWLADPSRETAALAAAAISAHGIYSTSFLELWSLSEGGYSLSILRLLTNAKAAGSVVEAGVLHEIGARKKGNRVHGLLKLKLARQHDNRFELTVLGRAVAAVFSGIAWAANLRELG
ncbi:MAG: hypothetical protein M3069_07455 [Chloroflexota bacterium]|nr:hypothetical protein [Chloroflexota bacterium]